MSHESGDPGDGKWLHSKVQNNLSDFSYILP